jgi:hypothetical protein
VSKATRLTCTWLIEAKEETPVHECSHTATVTYSKTNPRRRQPDEPKLLVYPRCSTHDTPAAQREAPKQGYERTEL